MCNASPAGSARSAGGPTRPDTTVVGSMPGTGASPDSAMPAVSHSAVYWTTKKKVGIRDMHTLGASGRAPPSSSSSRICTGAVLILVSTGTGLILRPAGHGSWPKYTPRRFIDHNTPPRSPVIFMADGPHRSVACQPLVGRQRWPAPAWIPASAARRLGMGQHFRAAADPAADVDHRRADDPVVPLANARSCTGCRRTRPCTCTPADTSTWSPTPPSWGP